MDEMDKSPPKKIPPQEQLKLEIAATQRKYRERALAISKEHQDQEAAIRTEILGRVAEVGRNAEAHRKAAQETRARRRREIEKEHDAAVRKAQGDRQKALNEAEATFEEMRSAINTQQTERTAPLETELKARSAAVAEALKGKLEELQAEATEVLKGLKDKLDALDVTKTKVQPPAAEQAP